MSEKNRRLFLNEKHELYLVEEELPQPQENEVLIQKEAFEWALNHPGETIKVIVYND